MSARTLNTITLLGRVGAEPQVRSTAEGTKVANLSLATNRRRGEEEVADWHRLVVWDKLASLVEDYVHKGDQLMVVGRMQYGVYERDGVTHSTAEVHVQKLVMTGTPNGAGERERE